MSTCAQQLTWHLKKEQLERLIQAAGSDYDALQFKFCINKNPETREVVTKYFMALVKVDLTQPNVCEGIVTLRTDEEEACPVPPDCNDDPGGFKRVLEQFHQSNVIAFNFSREAFIDAFQ